MPFITFTDDVKGEPLCVPLDFPSAKLPQACFGRAKCQCAIHQGGGNYYWRYTVESVDSGSDDESVDDPNPRILARLRRQTLLSDHQF
jgi:hypothetical protein